MRLARLELIVFASILFAALAIALGATAVEEDPPPDGDWFVIDSKEYTGKTGYVDGNLMIGTNSQLTLTDSTLVINQSLIVSSFSTLIIENSTIKFNCTPFFDNLFEVVDRATVTIKDRDNNRMTTHDRSVITSNTDMNYNWSVFPNATFSLTNSLVSKCGRFGNDPLEEEGLVIRSDTSIIQGTTFVDGYYGIIIDRASAVTLDNVTVEDCAIGLMMIGTRDLSVTNSRFANNSIYGVLIRGHEANLVFRNNVILGNADINLYVLSSSGFTNDISQLTIGPGGNYGVWVEESESYIFQDINVVGCDVGWELINTDTEVMRLTIENCTEGMDAKLGGTVRLDDLTLANTTIAVDAQVTTNVTIGGQITWRSVQGDLATFLSVSGNGEFTLEDSTIAFRDSQGHANGFVVERGTSITMSDSILESPNSGRWIGRFESGSLIDLSQVTVRNAGTTGGGSIGMGFYPAGTGIIEDLTITDSLAGLVVGKSNARLINITIMDSDIGILADGNLGRGGTEINNLVIEGCTEAVRGINEGNLVINVGTFDLDAIGFNLSASSVTLRDSRVGQASGDTAVLEDTSSLNLVNSSSSADYTFGTGDNIVNIFWYLNLTLKYLSDGSPLSEALVSVREQDGRIAVRDLEADIAGMLSKLEIREKSYTPILINGTPHTVTIKKGALEDSFTINLEGSMDYSFSMDNYPPILTIASPESGSFLNVSDVIVSGEAQDAVITATEGLETLRYRLDNGSWSPIALPSVKEWTFNVTVEDGFHVIEVEVVDVIGNMNSATITFEVDTTAPSLILISPDPGVPFQTNGTDLLIIGKTDLGATVTIDGVPITLSGSGDFSHTVDLVEGVNTISITVVDENGNGRTTVITAIRDAEPPLVTLSHQGEWSTNQSQVVIEGTKEMNATIFVDKDLPEFIGSTTFQVTIDLNEGTNAISIISVDGSGNVWQATVLIYLDSIAPTLVVTDLPEFTKNPAISIQGSTDDETATITVNGELVSLIGSAFSHPMVLTEGINTFTVTAVDDLGNGAEPVTIEVTLDTQSPPLSITSKRFVETEQDEHNLTGTTEPGLPVVISVVYGGAYSKTYDLIAGEDGSFEVEIRLPQVGNHTITITVDDLAGNRVTDQLNFVRVRPETKPPPTPSEPTWFEDNWEWVVLGVSVLASIMVLFLSMMPKKTRRVVQEAPPREEAPPEEETEDEGAEDDEEMEDEPMEEAEEEWEEED
jgi:hypothetical protein